MPRSTPPAAELAAALRVHTINPHSVYFPDQLRAWLRFKASTLRREVRAGRLRIAKRGGRYYVLGAWLLEWLQDGEVPRRRPRTAAARGNGES
jgi:hypothetical protein